MSTDRRTSTPAQPAPIQVSSSALAHQAAVRFYNDQLKRQAAAKGLNTANLPYAAPTTAPDDLMTLARRNGVDFGGSAPTEQGLHSGSGAVDPFNRPKPSTSQPQSQQTSSTASSSSVDPQRMAGVVAGGLNPGDPAGAVASRVLMPSTAPTTSDGTPIAPHLTQILQTPLPADVAQTALAQNRSAAGGITGLAAPVPLTGPTSIPTYGNGTATFAADMAARRAPGGSPYGMVPVDPTTQGQTYVGDGRMTFNGQVLPAGQTLTLLPNGRKIYGQVPAAPASPATAAQAPAAPAAATPAGIVPATLGNYATPQAVMASSTTAADEARNADFIKESASGPVAQAARAKLAAAAPAPEIDPRQFQNAGTVAGQALRAGIGQAGQAFNGAVGSTVGAVNTALGNVEDFGRTAVGLPPADPAARQNAAVNAVNGYAANNPSVAYLAKPPVATQAATPSNMAGGYNLSAYNLKPPVTPSTAVASAAPAAPAPAAPQATAPTAAPATGSPSIVANKGLLANAGIGTGTPLPSATSTNPLFVPTPSPQVNVNGTPASLAAAPTAAQALSVAPTASQALADAPSAAQALSRPGFQTNTGGVVSDTDSALNRRTDADQALNPDKPPGSVTPGAGNGLLNAGSNLMPGYVDQMRNQAASLDSSAPLTLGNTATNNGSTGLNTQPLPDHISTILGDYATPAGVAQGSTPGAPTPRTTAPNPGVVGATPTDPNTPLGDDEELVNGIRRKKLQSSTAPAPPGPGTASTNSSAPAAPSGSDS